VLYLKSSSRVAHCVRQHLPSIKRNTPRIPTCSCSRTVTAIFIDACSPANLSRIGQIVGRRCIGLLGILIRRRVRPTYPLSKRPVPPHVCLSTSRVAKSKRPNSISCVVLRGYGSCASDRVPVLQIRYIRSRRRNGETCCMDRFGKLVGLMQMAWVIKRVSIRIMTCDCFGATADLPSSTRITLIQTTFPTCYSPASSTARCWSRPISTTTV
jgi:hypothetical protein